MTKMSDKEIAEHVNDKWSFMQVKALVNNWGKLRSRELAEVVGKTNMACIGKAHRMGLDPVDPALRAKWCATGRDYTNTPRAYRRYLLGA